MIDDPFGELSDDEREILERSPKQIETVDDLILAVLTINAIFHTDPDDPEIRASSREALRGVATAEQRWERAGWDVDVLRDLRIEALHLQTERARLHPLS